MRGMKAVQLSGSLASTSEINYRLHVQYFILVSFAARILNEIAVGINVGYILVYEVVNFTLRCYKATKQTYYYLRHIITVHMGYCLLRAWARARIRAVFASNFADGNCRRNAR